MHLPKKSTDFFGTLIEICNGGMARREAAMPHLIQLPIKLEFRFIRIPL